MYIEIDFNSDEAIYIQLRNQIILGIATSELKDGESLPSVRALADAVGINMHTVSKAYAALKQEGFVRVDRRKGVVVSVDADKINTLAALKEYFKPLVAAALAKGIAKDELLHMISELYDKFTIL